MDYINADFNFIAQYAHQHESVHELYRIQDSTNSMVRISERSEKKGYHHCTVEVYHYLSEMDFSSSQFIFFINIQIWK